MPELDDSNPHHPYIYPFLYHPQYQLFKVYTIPIRMSSDFYRQFLPSWSPSLYYLSNSQFQTHFYSRNVFLLIIQQRYSQYRSPPGLFCLNNPTGSLVLTSLRSFQVIFPSLFTPLTSQASSYIVSISFLN